jgi:hypothetical protein
LIEFAHRRVQDQERGRAVFRPRFLFGTCGAANSRHGACTVRAHEFNEKMGKREKE